MRLTRYLIASEPFSGPPDGHTRRVLFATRSSSILVLDEGSWQHLERGEFASLPAHIVDRLTAEEVLVSDNDELSVVLDQNRAAAAQDDQLFLVIQPSADCQLGCDYCGQSHSRKSLTEIDQDRLLDRVAGRLETGHHRTLYVAWFGGEPLAGLPVMRSLTPQLRAVSAAYGCRYGAKLITNGLALTPKIATELVDEHSVQHIEITLDGTAPFHDGRRHRKTGQGTFDRIFGNLVDLAHREDLDVQISVRCNVDQRNVEGVSPLIRSLAETGIQQRISFYATPVYAWGNEAHRLALPLERFAEREADWMAEMLLHGFRPSLVPRRKPIVCLAAMPSGELVDAYGEVFNCTEVSYVPIYGVPNRYSIGKLINGASSTPLVDLRDFNDRIERREFPCSSCPMLPVCGGACPKKWREGFTPCPSFKWNIKDRLLLEFARTHLH